MNQELAVKTIFMASTWVVPVLLAITLHEAAHGFVAHRCGDDTAWRLGRVSFNPFKHIDLFGTILLPGMLLFLHAPFLFGYAKPVPVKFGALRNPRRDMVWVAAAGPATNLLLATAAALLVHFVGHKRAVGGATGGDRVTFIAELDERWVGLATGLAAADSGRSEPMLVGMFVDGTRAGVVLVSR
jgi:Zn-dependent protease